MSESGQVGLPFSFLVVLERSQHIQQGPFESLNYAIPHRMIGCSAGFLHSCKVAEAHDQLRLEVSSLITMDSGREPIVNEEILVEKSSSGVCRLVSRWNSLGIARKMLTRSAALVGRTFLRMHRSHFDVGVHPRPVNPSLHQT